MKNPRRVALLVSFALMSAVLHAPHARAAHAMDINGFADAADDPAPSRAPWMPFAPRDARPTAITGAAESWSGIGPDGADVTDVGVSPADAAILLATTSPSTFPLHVILAPHAGAYRSTDAGTHWTALPEFEGVAADGIAFASDGTAYIASEDSVWKSSDAGAHWQRLELGVGEIARVRTVAVDPDDDATLWACLNSNGGNTAITLAVSTDSGATWTDRTPSGAAFLDCEAVAVEVGGAHRVVATFNDPDWIGHVWRSDDHGEHWTDISAGLPQYRLYALAFAGTRIILGGGHVGGDDVGVYASDDSGAHWQSLSDASWPLLAVTAVAVAPNDPQTLVAATAGRGLNRSTDGGATWQLELAGTSRMYANAVRFAPGDGSHVLAGAMSYGVLESADAGAHFAQTNTGLRELYVSSITANPLDADELAAAFQFANGGGVYVSVDHGAHWQLQDLPPLRFSRVAFSPTGVLHAIGGGPTSPIQQEGLYRRNGDGSWTNLGPDQGPHFESDLRAVLFSATDPDLILLGGRDFGVAGFGGTIWRSPDAGTTWTKVYLGSDFDVITDFERAAGSGGSTLVASYDGQLPPYGGILRSTDAGADWSDSSTGLADGAGLPHLCQSGGATPSIYLAAITSPFGGGVYRSDDGGASWTPVSKHNGVLLDIACDPFDPSVLYMAWNSSQQPVLRSTDGGVTFVEYGAGIASYASVSEIFPSSYEGATQLLLGSSVSAYVLHGTDTIFVDGFESP
ncbi:MAG: WD40/YVTN/BNR-like repeat-containing protein [Dokdonella sp.]|uniref:WD40/YVTN/BNR-like repeat-containing protein n=1 Tax=Dokdonella sp. TaxID=2291710 RepID=UPI003F7F0CC7